jgi:DmsE family decaheme c-type cytochrome
MLGLSKSPLVLSILFVVMASGQELTKPTSNGFAGNDVCRGCHPAVWQNFYKNPHYKSVAAGDLPASKSGCEGCHGPAQKHVDAKGGKATILAFSELPAKQALDACLGCHSKDISRHNIRRSSHTQADIACNSCHSIHKSASSKSLLASKQSELCTKCHSSVRTQFSMPFKHRVNEGSMQCSDCHNPHGSAAPTTRMSSRPRMMEHAQANEQSCIKCHADKRGPFAFEHAALRVDGCETCHSPHGSMNPKLLRRPAVFTLCLECHNGAPGSGRTTQGIPTQSGSHNMADPRYQNCTTCHVRIHGSNSDPLFLR